METHSYLEGVIDPPLETSEGTDHNNSCSESVPESLEADITIYFCNLGANWGAAASLVEDGDHGISRVGNKSAEDTSPITRDEGDHELEVLGVGVLRVGEHICVESLHGLLKA